MRYCEIRCLTTLDGRPMGKQEFLVINMEACDAHGALVSNSKGPVLSRTGPCCLVSRLEPMLTGPEASSACIAKMHFLYI